MSHLENQKSHHNIHEQNLVTKLSNFAENGTNYAATMKEPYPNRTYQMQTKVRIHKVSKAELDSFPNYPSTPPVRM
jgi:hypothetical protein